MAVALTKQVLSWGKRWSCPFPFPGVLDPSPLGPFLGCLFQHPTLGGKGVGRADLAAGKDLVCVGGKYNGATLFTFMFLKAAPSKIAQHTQ